MRTNSPDRHALPGYAALDRADVPDAKRRRPDVDLRPYAEARGLTFLGQGDVPGYELVVPRDERLRHNVMAGPLGPGRDGCLLHWVRPFGVIDGRPIVGTFHGVHYRTPSSGEPWWKAVTDLSWLPWIGWIFALMRNAEVTTQPTACGVPCTVAATVVPETSGVQNLAIDNRPWPAFVDLHRERLKDRGLPGFTLTADQAPPAWIADALLSPSVRAVLADGGRAPLFEVRLRRGVVSVCRNGYASTDADLDALRAAAATVAAALGERVRGAA